MKTIREKQQAIVRSRGSKFIGHLFYAANKDEFDNQLEYIKHQYPDATHYCYARRHNPHRVEEFYRGDGEPHGTAGLPILNQLKSFDAVNCGCVVVRYYGGTNLGKPGLIEAYGNAAKLCLDKAAYLRLILTKTFRITYDYENQSRINHLKNVFDLKELDGQYRENVCLNVACRIEEAEKLAGALQNLEHLGITSEELGNSFVTVQ